jgi:hypothetical protein
MTMMLPMSTGHGMSGVVAELGIEKLMNGRNQFRLISHVFNLPAVRQVLVDKSDPINASAEFFQARHFAAVDVLRPGKIALSKTCGNLCQMFTGQCDLLGISSVFDNHLLHSAGFGFVEEV